MSKSVAHSFGRYTILAFISATTFGMSLRIAEAQSASKPEAVISVAGVNFSRTYHSQNLVPDRGHAGFSALLYDAKGELVLHDGNKTWLYTTSLFEAPTGGQRDWYGKWISDVRELNIETLVSSEKKVALGLAPGDQ